MSGGPFDGLGPVLLSLRTDRRLTQEALAVRAGVTKAMLSNYEGGKQRPHLDTLERLLNGLGVSLGQLATRLERHGDRDGAEDDHVVVDRLLDAIEGAQAAAQEAGEEELARALVTYRTCWPSACRDAPSSPWPS